MLVVVQHLMTQVYVQRGMHSQGKKFIGSSQLGGRAVTRSLVPNSGICYEFNNKGECSYGAVCKYRHMCLQ